MAGVFCTALDRTNSIECGGEDFGRIAKGVLVPSLPCGREPTLRHAVLLVAMSARRSERDLRLQHSLTSGDVPPEEVLQDKGLGRRPRADGQRAEAVGVARGPGLPALHASSPPDRGRAPGGSCTRWAVRPGTSEPQRASAPRSLAGPDSCRTEPYPRAIPQRRDQ